MEMKRRIRGILMVLLLGLDAFFITAGFLLMHSSNAAGGVGQYVVRQLYTFEAIEDVPQQVLGLKPYLSDDAWEHVDFDGEFRVINTYYKFDAQASEVHDLMVRDGFVAYRLLSPVIPASDIWIFEYDIDRQKICNLHEYKMTNVCYGREGVW